MIMEDITQKDIRDAEEIVQELEEAKQEEDPKTEDSESKIIPLTLAPDPVLAALHNCKNFDWPRFRRWIAGQSETQKKMAESRPPDRVYAHEETGELVFIRAYLRKIGGRIEVRKISDTEATFEVDPLQLRDVTQELFEKHGVT